MHSFSPRAARDIIKIAFDFSALKKLYRNERLQIASRILCFLTKIGENKETDDN